MPFYYKLRKGDPVDTRIAGRLLLLKDGLKRNGVPEKNIDRTLLVATWNIREFDSANYGARDKECLFYIAEIISSFDLVAIQEVRDDLKALNEVVKILGGWWRYIVTDVTEGKRGNKERMAFIFDSRKIRFDGLAGEVVIPPVEDSKGKTIQPSNQLYRTPFMVGFRSGWFKFVICTAHIAYGKGVADDPEREEEIEELVKFLVRKRNEEYAWSKNWLLLGDFNIFKPEDKTFRIITENGFVIPDKLQKLPSNASRNKHYDQIAFLTDSINKEDLDCQKAGVFNFYNYVYTLDDRHFFEDQMGEAYLTSEGKPREERSKINYYSTKWRTYQMSDHLPMWVELKVDFGEEYLRNKTLTGQP